MMEFHPVANIFPMMGVEEYTALKADVAANGLIEPIWTHQGKIIDGRNRYNACTELGIEPRYREWSGRGSLVSFVVSLNLKRRHLTSSQKAAVGVEVKRQLQDENPQGARHDLTGGNISTSGEKKNRDLAGEIVGVSGRYIDEAEKLEEEAPALFESVLAGEMSIPEAKKQIKQEARRADIERQREEIASGTAVLPGGVFEVIAIDPPWPYGTEYDPEGRRAANPYPEMSLEEIAALDIPAADNCVLWLWTTHKFMRYSFALLDAWGFRDVAIVTWEKSRMGLGAWLRSNSEFCIMAVKGSPKVDLTNQTTVIHGAMREHSRKPEEFYEMVNSLCIGRKLDYFSREARPGWECFGNDTGKFSDGGLGQQGYSQEGLFRRELSPSLFGA